MPNELMNQCTKNTLPTPPNRDTISDHSPQRSQNHENHNNPISTPFGITRIGELTKEDIRTIFREEITASEKRTREYIDLKVEALNQRIDDVEKNLNDKIDSVEKNLNDKSIT